MALGDDLLADRGVERAVHVAPAAARAHRCRRARRSPARAARRAPRRRCRVRAAHTSAIRSASSRRATKPRICAEALVEPLRVVDDADAAVARSATSASSVSVGEPDQEPVRRGPGARPEHRRERVALRAGQPIEMIEHRRAELVQPAVGQLHLRLDADGPRDVPAGDAVGQIVQQRALARRPPRRAARRPGSDRRARRSGAGRAPRTHVCARGASNAEPDPGSSAASRRRHFWR